MKASPARGTPTGVAPFDLLNTPALAQANNTRSAQPTPVTPDPDGDGIAPVELSSRNTGGQLCPAHPLAFWLWNWHAAAHRSSADAYTQSMKIPRPTETAAVTRWSTCPECGESYEQDDTTNAYCDECKQQQRRETERQRDRGKTTTELGYGHRWQQLSKRARRQQDFCSDCGSTDDLTVDHSMEAWRAHEAGKTITLDMLDVVCRRCNGERGPARGPDATDAWRNQAAELFARIYADETD